MNDNYRATAFLALMALMICQIKNTYILLSTDVSTKRAKKLGIRKTYGADDFNII